MVIENEFKKKLLSDVIPLFNIGVTFDDIRALVNMKDTLKEFVMLPLQRHELFCKGQLTKVSRNITFCTSGTRKTMLAKAIATKAGANFMNISMSSITSKWFGEGEKYVKPVFSLASKIATSVIFVDKVDSMLGRYERCSKQRNRFSVILAKEDLAPSVDLAAIANMTYGYSGSDLKVCASVSLESNYMNELL
ncbi:hypothetical protein RJT34_12695 [Clitoria ternatea]|uniref:ATPase AAA-type core domain-containing protein n=1 Tax=Clitoria ternatea TaxID=43366 RepID=A0AAN9PL53_CLITE